MALKAQQSYHAPIVGGSQWCKSLNGFLPVLHFCHTQKREQPFGNGIGEAYGSEQESEAVSHLTTGLEAVTGQ
jgi:hypothetical protein